MATPFPSDKDKPIPKVLQSLVESFIKTARENLERDGNLMPVAIVGNSLTQDIIPVAFKPTDEASKDQAAHLIRQVAAQVSANFIFMIIDGWGLRSDKMKDYKKIISIYGSIGASPYRVDVASFTLETKTGLWMAQAEQKKLGLSNKKKTFGEIKFFTAGEGEGRFMNLLRPLDS